MHPAVCTQTKIKGFNGIKQAAQAVTFMAHIQHVHSLNTGQETDRSDQLFSWFTAKPPRTSQPLPSTSLPLHYSLTISLPVAIQAEMMESLLHKMYQTNSSQITAVSIRFVEQRLVISVELLFLQYCSYSKHKAVQFIYQSRTSHY